LLWAGLSTAKSENYAVLFTTWPVPFAGAEDAVLFVACVFWF
jgi:hypothetical protein